MAELHSLATAFSAFVPSVNAANHYVEFYRIEASTVDSMERFLHDQGVNYDIVVEERPSQAEILAARFVPLSIEGDYIDEDQAGNPLNRYEEVTCLKCLLPKENLLPNPYIVSDKRVRRAQDVYCCSNGFIVLSKRFQNGVAARFGNSVKTGKVVVMETAPKRLKDSYFWVRGVSSLGTDTRKKVINNCAACGAPTEIRQTEAVDRITNAKVILESFQDVRSEIALCGNWYGKRSSSKPMSVVRNTFISGAAYFYLKELGIRGLVRPSNVVIDASSQRKA